ncbi:MAG: DUF262 domain-containing protein [Aurantimonas endophytica]|uniref:DUF262 domain-containing protein n=1 Tax=Aurantimonas endophytica TaxID=1522175 RepID=UPI0030029381
MSQALMEEVRVARTEIVSDGYEMSVGEILNLYRDDELKIDPAFQRLFRWDDTRKTRFIESLLLGIPVPPVFVFQDENGVWELIDGLQRLSTVFQFAGVLRGERAVELGPLELAGTNFLPSLAGKRWEPSAPGADDGVGQALQLQVKRARLRVEILKKESDAQAKYELFQRLNTGGASLSEQEIRNCVAVMLNKDFYEWLVERSRNPDFVQTTSQTETAISAQAGVELALRFFAFQNVPYSNGLDVHEYLDQALTKLATDADFDQVREGRIFDRTFSALADALGDSSFKRWDGTNFRGKFLMSVFEVMAPGVAQNIEVIDAMDAAARNGFIREKAVELWENDVFRANSGGGVRGTTRLVNLLPMAAEFLRPA